MVVISSSAPPVGLVPESTQMTTTAYVESCGVS
jgi:hypothetical protein